MSFSVITPSYNQGQFITRTIESVLSQSIPDLDYIVVDGGSTDNTVEILKTYGSKLRWLSEKDKGQSDAVNKGLKLTLGEIIGWLNSDDIYYPNALKTVNEFFNLHPQIDVVYGDAYHIDSNDQVLERYYTESWNIEKLKEVCYLCQPAVFFRRRVIDQYGMINENLQYCMDYEFWLRLALKGVRFAYLNQILAGSRLHADTKTLGSRVKVHKEINTMLKTVLGKVPNRWLSNYAHALVESKKHYSPTLAKKAIALHSLLAAFRWNHRIDKSFLFLTFNWLFK